MKSDREQFIRSSLRESAATKQRIEDELLPQISKAIDLIKAALQNKKKILLCGNGGSAADAQHLATEFVIRLSPGIQRPGLPAIALTTDTSILTAGANDLGYDNVFARSVDALGYEGDVLIGISTSGNSRNIIRAAAAAREIGLLTIGLTGPGGKLAGMVDLNFAVKSQVTARIQESHMMLGHLLCELVDRILFPEKFL